MADEIPGQAAENSAAHLYWHLKSVYILGFLEVLLGLAVIVIECTAIALFFDDTLSYPLEIVGIFVGLLVVLTGLSGFFAGRNLIEARTRHNLFLVGIFLTLAALVAVGSMLVLSALRTHYLYKDVEDKEGRENSDLFRNLPYVFSLEGSRHLALLRAIAAVVYALLFLFFLGSLFLNCCNVTKNSKNINGNTTAVYSPVSGAEFSFGSPKKRGKTTEL